MTPLLDGLAQQVSVGPKRCWGRRSHIGVCCWYMLL